jgi:hypothetical protein
MTFVAGRESDLMGFRVLRPLLRHDPWTSGGRKKWTKANRFYWQKLIAPSHLVHQTKNCLETLPLFVVQDLIWNAVIRLDDFIVLFDFERDVLKGKFPPVLSVSRVTPDRCNQQENNTWTRIQSSLTSTKTITSIQAPKRDHNAIGVFRKFIILVSLNGEAIAMLIKFIGTQGRKAVVSQSTIDIASGVKQRSVQSSFNTSEIICTEWSK